MSTIADTTSGDSTLDAAISAAQERIAKLITSEYDRDLAVQALDAVANQVAALLSASTDPEA